MSEVGNFVRSPHVAQVIIITLRKHRSIVKTAVGPFENYDAAIQAVHEDVPKSGRKPSQYQIMNLVKPWGAA